MSTETTVDVVLRVLGEFDLETLLQENRGFEPDAIWRQGEVPGRPRLCGFNKLLSGDIAPQEAGRELLLTLSTYRHMLQQLPSGSAQIDIGVFTCDSPSGVVLEGRTIEALAGLGLGLSFTYYPSFD